ncbi:MAG: hypothetical protein AAGB14_09285 [Verrucomicrobiota bacterium]
MKVFAFENPIDWESFDFLLDELSTDWSGNPVVPSAKFGLARDPERFWFVASHQEQALFHPQARAGHFQPELWQWDVAELFLADPASGRYLELNLAPNGAWWSCEFTAPRERAREQNEPFPGVETFAKPFPDGGWKAALTIPLKPLRERLAFGDETAANVTFILRSPKQQFLSATKLGDGDPDFHRPEQFPRLRFQVSD